MTLLSAGARPQVGQVAEPDTLPGHHPGPVLVAAVTLLRAVAAAVCGLILTSGVALLIWAVSPQNSVGPRAFLNAGALAFAAGSGLPIGIGRAVLTLPPLLLGVLGMALLTAAVGRGRYTARTLVGETSSAVAAGVGYGAVVTVLPALLGPSGAVHTDRWWVPLLMATAVAGACAILRGEYWRALIIDRLPLWSLTGLRLGVVAVGALIGTGAVAVAGGLATSFSAVTRLSAAAAPGVADGAGMLLLQLCYLPNAVIAGTGFASGIGFTIGSGSYTPFGSSITDLPAIPLLAAGPEVPGPARLGLLLLLGPVFAAFVIGRGAVRRLAARADRLRATAAASLIAAVSLGLLAALSAGGVTGGNWASSGVPALRFALVVALELGALSAAVVWVASVPGVQGAGTDGDADSEADGHTGAAGVGGLNSDSGSGLVRDGDPDGDGDSANDRNGGESDRPSDDAEGPAVTVLQNPDVVATAGRDSDSVDVSSADTSFADVARDESAPSNSESAGSDAGVAGDSDQHGTGVSRSLGATGKAEQCRNSPRPAPIENADVAGRPNAAGSVDEGGRYSEGDAAAEDAGDLAPADEDAGDLAPAGEGAGDVVPAGGATGITTDIAAVDEAGIAADVDGQRAKDSPIDSRSSGRRRFGDDRGRRREGGRQTRR